MSAVFGPVSSLPGSVHKVPDGMMCDDHPDIPAVKRIQGETDSMGCEMHDLCQACADRMLGYEPEPAKCDWCPNVEVLKPRRDYDEGMSGPVYHVCKACRDKQAEEAASELEDRDRYDFQDMLSECEEL